MPVARRGPEPLELWHGPLCRALVARDVSRSEVLPEPLRRRACAALVHAMLGPGAAAGDRRSAAGDLVRGYVAPLEPAPECAGVVPEIVTALFDDTRALELLLVLPAIETDRGLAPQP